MAPPHDSPPEPAPPTARRLDRQGIVTVTPYHSLMRMGGPHSMLGSDPSAVKGAKLDRHLLRRVWLLARRYRRMLTGYPTTIVLEAVLGIVPALLIKRIVDV